MVDATGMKDQISNICCLEYNCILSLNTRRVKMNTILSGAGGLGNLTGVKEREAVLVEDYAPGARFMLFAGEPYREVPFFNGPFVD
jgi:hypothetical protein